MSEKKWTSGPWHVMEKRTSKPQGRARVYAADNELRYIAECDDFGNIEDITDNVANANLIAAAPELYEALVAVVDECEYSMSSCLYGDARAALAKARGEA